MKNIAFVMLVVMLVAYGCYPGGGETTDDYTIVRTQYNTAYDFGSKKTYYMADTMKFTSNVDDEKIDTNKLKQYETTFLNAIEKNLDERGYERITDTNEIIANGVDLVILPGGILADNSGAVWYPGYGWWGGYYPPGWGWGGGGWYYPPGYGGYWTAYSYQTGTALINILDYDSYDESNGEFIEMEWDVLINGLFQSVNASRIEALVDQAFVQSPYLMSN